MQTEVFMTAFVALLICGAVIARMMWPGSLIGQILLFSAPAVFLESLNEDNNLIRCQIDAADDPQTTRI